MSDVREIIDIIATAIRENEGTYTNEARAVRAALKAQGYEIVPREPTREMLKAAHDEHVKSGCMFYEGAETEDLYRAMIAASQNTDSQPG